MNITIECAECRAYVDDLPMVSFLLFGLPMPNGIRELGTRDLWSAWVGWYHEHGHQEGK